MEICHTEYATFLAYDWLKTQGIEQCLIGSCVDVSCKTVLKKIFKAPDYDKPQKWLSFTIKSTSYER